MAESASEYRTSSTDTRSDLLVVAPTAESHHVSESPCPYVGERQRASHRRAQAYHSPLADCRLWTERRFGTFP